MGHSYLFYLTGEITKGLLQEADISYEKTYMERNRVFTRYHSLLEEYLQAYVERKMTLSEATEKIITAVYNRKR